MSPWNRPLSGNFQTVKGSTASSGGSSETDPGGGWNPYRVVPESGGGPAASGGADDGAFAGWLPESGPLPSILDHAVFDGKLPGMAAGCGKVFRVPGGGILWHGPGTPGRRPDPGIFQKIRLLPGVSGDGADLKGGWSSLRKDPDHSAGSHNRHLHGRSFLSGESILRPSGPFDRPSGCPSLYRNGNGIVSMGADLLF